MDINYIKIKKEQNELLIKYNRCIVKKKKSIYYKQIIELDKQLEKIKNDKEK